MYQLAGHFEDLFARALLELFPSGAAQLVEHGYLAVGTGVFTQAIELFDRDEDAVLVLIGHDEAIVLAPADSQAADARVSANAVVDVNDEIAALQGAVVGDGLGGAEPAVAVAALLAAEDLVVVEQG